MTCTHDAAPDCPNDWEDHEIECPTCGAALFAYHDEVFDEESGDEWDYHYWLDEPGYRSVWKLPPPVLCDFCVARAVAVSTEGDPSTRRARCEAHRARGSTDYFATMRDAPRTENAWIRDRANRLDEYVMPEIRKRNAT